LRGRLGDRILGLGHHQHGVLVDRAALGLEELVEEGPHLLLPLLAGALELLARFLVVEEDEAARPAIGQRHQVEAVEDAGPALGRETVDRHDAEIAVLDHRREAVMELGRRQPVEIHRDLGQADRMVLAGDAEADELEQLVVARDRGSRRARDRLAVTMRRIDSTLPRYCSTSRIEVWKLSSTVSA
jgi:hypothetical protein